MTKPKKTPKRRTCSKCRRNLSLSAFPRDRTRKKGRGYQCRICRRESDRHRSQKPRAKRRKSQGDRERVCQRNLVILDKLRSGCVDCGETELVVLEFDHVRGEKSGEISTLRRRGSLSQLKIELRKCVVRCANCHRRKTAEECGDWRLNLAPAD